MKFKEFMKRAGVIKESLDTWRVNEHEDGYGQDYDDPDQPDMKDTGMDDKPNQPVKTSFKEGDTLILIDNKKSSKIPNDAWDFLMTYKLFKVERVSDSGKLDLGCHISKNTPEGGVEKIYMFSPKRFALKDASDIKNVD